MTTQDSAAKLPTNEFTLALNMALRAADRPPVSYYRIWHLIMSGALPAERHGKRWIVPIAQIEQFVQAELRETAKAT